MRIPIVILVILVATAIFVVILRANRSNDDRGRSEAAARGETVAPRKINPTLVYFGLGVVFIVIGLITVLNR